MNVSTATMKEVTGPTTIINEIKESHALQQS